MNQELAISSEYINIYEVNKIANMERRTCEEQGVPAKHIVRGNPDRGRNPLFPQIRKL